MIDGIIELKERKTFYSYPSGADFRPREFGLSLGRLIGAVRELEGKERVLFLCIGSDRSTGDSLGPLVGYKLAGRLPHACLVFGTLEHPVHAVNLQETMALVRRRCGDCVVVAVDASIGQREQVGHIHLGAGAIQPGLGVSKQLEPIGDIFITGVVGSGREREPWVLQSVRLSRVMRLADAICQGIMSMDTLECRTGSKDFFAPLTATDNLCGREALR